MRPSTATVGSKPLKKDIFEAQNYNGNQQSVVPTWFKPKTPAVWSPAGGKRDKSESQQR